MAWSCGHRTTLRRVIVLADLVRSLAGLLELVVPAKDAAIDDLTLAEPGRDVLGIPGDLTVGVGGRLGGRRRPAGNGSRAARRPRRPALRAGVAHLPEVRAAARDHGVARRAGRERLVGARDLAPARPGRPHPGPAGPTGERLGGALCHRRCRRPARRGPITIEDAHSRVLAYSSRQDSTDPARVSTIVGAGSRTRSAATCALGGLPPDGRLPASFFVDGGPDSPVGPRHVGARARRR